MKTETRTAFKSRIARILLNTPDGTLSKYRVAKLAGCGYPWAHALLDKMQGDGLIEGTRVVDYEALFSWWGRWRPAPQHRGYMLQEPLSALRSAGMPYALTTYLAENKLQNYLFPSRTDLHVRCADVPAWHRFFAYDGLVGNGNVRLLYGDDHALYKRAHVDGLDVASMPQVILDLYAAGCSCVEAADMLVERLKANAVLKPLDQDPQKRPERSVDRNDVSCMLEWADGLSVREREVFENACKSTRASGLGSLSVPGMGHMEINDADTLALAESYMEILRKRLTAKAP